MVRLMWDFSGDKWNESLREIRATCFALDSRKWCQKCIGSPQQIVFPLQLSEPFQPQPLGQSHTESKAWSFWVV